MTDTKYEAETMPNPAGGEQRIFTFANGYGASVVRGPYSYGGPSGLFELAVLGPDGDLCYDTPITNDVEGWLSEDHVQTLLAQIDALPAVR